MWTSHSRRSPLVPSTIPGRGPLADQLVYGRPSGRPTTPRVVHWWTLHRLRVISSGPPATPWRVHWWASHSWARTTGEPSTTPGSKGFTGGLHPKGGPLVIPALQERSACGPATLRGCSLMANGPRGSKVGPPPVKRRGPLVERDSIGGTLVSQPLQGWSTGARSARGRGGGQLVDPVLQGASACGPATPGETSWCPPPFQGEAHWRTS